MNGHIADCLIVRVLYDVWLDYMYMYNAGFVGYRRGNYFRYTFISAYVLYCCLDIAECVCSNYSKWIRHQRFVEIYDFEMKYDIRYTPVYKFAKDKCSICA